MSPRARPISSRPDIAGDTSADQSKFGRSAPVRIARIDQIGTFVTDHCPSPAFRALCADAGVTLVETEQWCRVSPLLTKAPACRPR